MRALTSVRHCRTARSGTSADTHPQLLRMRSTRRFPGALCQLNTVHGLSTLRGLRRRAQLTPARASPPGSEQRNRTRTAPDALQAQETARPHYLVVGAFGAAVRLTLEARRAELRGGPERRRTARQLRNTPRTGVFSLPLRLLVSWVRAASLEVAWARVLARPQTEWWPATPSRTRARSSTDSRPPPCPKLLAPLRTGILTR